MITRYCIDKLSTKYGLVKKDKLDGFDHYCYLPDSNIWDNEEYNYPSAIFTIYKNGGPILIRLYDRFNIDNKNKKVVFIGGTNKNFEDITEDIFEKYILRCISKVKKAIIKFKLNSISKDFK